MEAAAPSAAAPPATTAQPPEPGVLPTAAAPPTTDASVQAGAEPPLAPSVTGFIKKSRNRGNIRKRQQDDGGAEGDSGAPSTSAPPIARRAKLLKAEAPMAFTTRRGNDDRAAPFQFKSSRTLQQTTDQGATATLETETDFNQDARWVPHPCPHLSSPFLLIHAQSDSSHSFRFARDFAEIVACFLTCNFSCESLPVDVAMISLTATFLCQYCRVLTLLCLCACRALREQVLAQAGPEAADGAPSDGMYHGMNNYTDYKKVCAETAPPPRALPVAHILFGQQTFNCGLQFRRSYSCTITPYQLNLRSSGRSPTKYCAGEMSRLLNVCGC